MKAYHRLKMDVFEFIQVISGIKMYYIKKIKATMAKLSIQIKYFIIYFCHKTPTFAIDKPMVPVPQQMSSSVVVGCTLHQSAMAVKRTAAPTVFTATMAILIRCMSK